MRHRHCDLKTEASQLLLDTRVRWRSALTSRFFDQRTHHPHPQLDLLRPHHQPPQRQPTFHTLHTSSHATLTRIFPLLELPLENGDESIIFGHLPLERSMQALLHHAHRPTTSLPLSLAMNLAINLAIQPPELGQRMQQHPRRRSERVARTLEYKLDPILQLQLVVHLLLVDDNFSSFIGPPWPSHWLGLRFEPHKLSINALQHVNDVPQE